MRDNLRAKCGVRCRSRLWMFEAVVFLLCARCPVSVYDTLFIDDYNNIYIFSRYGVANCLRLSNHNQKPSCA